MIHDLNFAQQGPEYFTILGIDPGSTTMGVSAMHVNFATLQIHGAELLTLHALKPTGGRQINQWMLDTHSERSMRLRELAWMLGQQLMYQRPVFVACEAPFFNPRNPNAYQVLVETMKVIENTVYAWNPWRPLYRIETTVAKKAVAPKDPAGILALKAIKDSKEKVRFCVERHPEIAKWVNYAIHDEHNVDALIVAYAQLTRIRANDFSITF